MEISSRSIKAIVTGHTQGLGGALAAELLFRGIPVLGLARGLSAQLAADFPETLTQVQIDLGAAAALEQWLGGPVLRDFVADSATALLLNNAGTVQPVGALTDQSLAAVAMAVSLNVAAPLMLSAALAQATQGRECRILHVSSGAGSSAYPGWSVYCATKAALDHHARAVALDQARGVRVCSLAPGVIDTGMQAQIRATPVKRFPMLQRFLDLKRDGALSSPEECAGKVVAYALAPGFGREPVADLRQVQGSGTAAQGWYTRT